MKPNTTLLKGLRVTMPAAPKPVYKAPNLSAITVDELPNNTFEKENQYHITQSATGTWPVYKKIQNTKITTEIKRVKGNAALFAEELSRVLFKNNVPKKHVRVNTLTGEVNIKGDRSSEIRTILNEMAK